MRIAIGVALWSLGPNSLYRGITIGSIFVVRKVINTDPALINTTNTKYGPPLNYAIWSGETEIALLLISNGADPTTKHHGYSPLDVAIAKENKDVAEAILQAQESLGINRIQINNASGTRAIR
jgi:ankyrin repeat protein